eukprot:TRINITY_DN10654_c0_g2_i1.p1 TRINITY_DN10654_c0_g2~~TRINITY_DN10654_c0_g2_i1.p1  ORF type:complete len:452 (+),score=81.00 TRINITY_DN10654_c0_g2_i1:156-1511(+)
MDDFFAMATGTMCKCETGDPTFRPLELIVVPEKTEFSHQYHACGEVPILEERPVEEDYTPQPSASSRRGSESFCVDVNLPLRGPPVKQGWVWYLVQNSDVEDDYFQKVYLSVYYNGISIRRRREHEPSISVAWSPFALVQACRLHNALADNAQPLLRLFKISVFHHGLTHHFALYGENAADERARWVAEVSRALRIMTQSLLPPYQLTTTPLQGAGWTATRLLAGYMLLYDDMGVTTVYSELHAHTDSSAGFAVYEDESCLVQVVHIAIDTHTTVSERIGVDCSCFGLGNHHFTTRSCAEKNLWLRAISNIKVKLRHWADAPSHADMRHYRSAVRDQISSMPPLHSGLASTEPKLPRRKRVLESAPLQSAAHGVMTGHISSVPLMRAEDDGSNAAPPVPTNVSETSQNREALQTTTFTHSSSKSSSKIAGEKLKVVKKTSEPTPEPAPEPA